MNTIDHWTSAVHHDGSALYVSNPLPAHNERVTVRLRVPLESPIRSIYLRTAPDGENKLDLMHEVERDSTAAWWAGELPVSMPRNPYRFKLMTTDGAYYYNARGISRGESPDVEDFKLLADFAAPDWLETTVFYQIFPDRFHNGDPINDVKAGEWGYRNFKTQIRPWGAPPLPWSEAGNLDFYGGDLVGIEQKLDYLADLGVNALYLTPIFTSSSNHRYDISDFSHVDPHLGGDASLASLRRALDTHAMHIILDVTLNHCGWQNHWFTDAQADLQSLTASYFTFYNHRPEQYETWLGVATLPKLNYRSEALRDAMYRTPDSVLRSWLHEPYRIDGWRLDVANMQARQGAIQLGNKVGRQLRKAVKADSPQAYIYGEHFYDGTPHLQGDELDASMNYQGFTMPLWRWLNGHEHGAEWRPESADQMLLPAEALVEQWTRFRAAVPWAIARQQFNLLDSHDTPRILYKVDGDKALMRLAAVLLMTYVGVPCIYYGDEIGLAGGNDPDNRRCMPWDEAEWDHDLRAHYKKLIALRKTAPALRYGGYQDLHALDGLLVFQRQSAEQRLIVIGHRGPVILPSAQIPLHHGGIRDGARLVDLLSDAAFVVANGAITVGPLERGAALILEERA